VIYFVGLVVLVLATARLTRLIYFDDITMRMRTGIDARFGQDSFLSRVAWCPWCASVWAAMALSAPACTGLWLWGHWPAAAAAAAWLPLALAASYPAGWIVDRETTLTSRGD